MRKLIFCIFMMLPAGLFGFKDYVDEADFSQKQNFDKNYEQNFENNCGQEKDCEQNYFDCECKGVTFVDDASPVNADEEIIVNFNSLRDEVATVVDHLIDFEEEIEAKINSEIEKIENVYPVDQARIEYLNELKISYVQKFEIMNLIVNRDVDGLRNIDSERFSKDFFIMVDGDKFENNLEGRLSAFDMKGSNMLAWVLFASAINTTKEDNEKTLQILEIMLDKGVDVNSTAGRSYWVVERGGDAVASDHNISFPLVELAILYSFPKAVELLLKYGAKFIKRRVEFCVHCRIISSLINYSVEKGVPQAQLEKLKRALLNYLEVLEVIMLEGTVRDESGQDNIAIFDRMFCKYANQAV